MVKHTKTIRRQKLTSCLIVFVNFVVLVPKGSMFSQSYYAPIKASQSHLQFCKFCHLVPEYIHLHTNICKILLSFHISGGNFHIERTRSNQYMFDYHFLGCNLNRVQSENSKMFGE